MSLNHREKYLQLNYVPRFFLDIGAHDGSYARGIKELFPDTRVFCIEPTHTHDLTDLDHVYALLGANLGVVTWYEATGPHTTGNSCFLEDTGYFLNNHKAYRRITIPLDSLKLRPDFIKIDTQGSELEIFRGGTQTLKECRYILCEVSHQTYNIGAPLAEEVDEFLVSQGFVQVDVWSTNHRAGQPLQSDFLYENKGLGKDV